jgi:glutaredoxin 3
MYTGNGSLLMKRVTIYTTPWCGFCLQAKRLLQELEIPFDDIDVSGDPGKRSWLAEKTGQHTVPQIFFGDESIGGCDELYALHRSAQLMERLAESH